MMRMLGIPTRQRVTDGASKCSLGGGTHAGGEHIGSVGPIRWT